MAWLFVRSFLPLPLPLRARAFMLHAFMPSCSWSACYFGCCVWCLVFMQPYQAFADCESYGVHWSKKSEFFFFIVDTLSSAPRVFVLDFPCCRCVCLRSILSQQAKHTTYTHTHTLLSLSFLLKNRHHGTPSAYTHTHTHTHLPHTRTTDTTADSLLVDNMLSLMKTLKLDTFSAEAHPSLSEHEQVCTGSLFFVLGLSLSRFLC